VQEALACATSVGGVLTGEGETTHIRVADPRADTTRILVGVEGQLQLAQAHLVRLAATAQGDMIDGCIMYMNVHCTQECPAGSPAK
jgi:hypothetical protein